MVPIKPQVLISMSGWCCVSQPMSVPSQKELARQVHTSRFKWKPRDSQPSGCMVLRGLRGPITKLNINCERDISQQLSLKWRHCERKSCVPMCRQGVHLKPGPKLFSQYFCCPVGNKLLTSKTKSSKDEEKKSVSLTFSTRPYLCFYDSVFSVILETLSCPYVKLVSLA